MVLHNRQNPVKSQPSFRTKISQHFPFSIIHAPLARSALTGVASVSVFLCPSRQSAPLWHLSAIFTGVIINYARQAVRSFHEVLGQLEILEKLWAPKWRVTFMSLTREKWNNRQLLSFKM